MNNATIMNIPITDDYMFCHVFADRDKCKELLERVLGITIAEIAPPTYQMEIRGGIDAHGIRLDIYVKDTEGNVYDIEMQTYSLPSIGKRARYYHSEMDHDTLKRGELYSKLRKNIVIFFYCYSDPFNRGRAVYTFTNACEEDPTIKLNDDITTIIIYPYGSLDGVDGKLANVIEYISTGDAKDEFTKSIEDRTLELSQDMKWRDGYMTYQQRLLEIQTFSYEDGYADGALGIIFDHFNKGYIDYDTALNDSKLPETEFNTKYAEWKSNNS